MSELQHAAIFKNSIGVTEQLHESGHGNVPTRFSVNSLNNRPMAFGGERDGLRLPDNDPNRTDHWLPNQSVYLWFFQRVGHRDVGG